MFKRRKRKHPQELCTLQKDCYDPYTSLIDLNKSKKSRNNVITLFVARKILLSAWWEVV